MIDTIFAILVLCITAYFGWNVYEQFYNPKAALKKAAYYFITLVVLILIMILLVHIFPSLDGGVTYTP